MKLSGHWITLLVLLPFALGLRNVTVSFNDPSISCVAYLLLVLSISNTTFNRTTGSWTQNTTDDSCGVCVTVIPGSSATLLFVGMHVFLSVFENILKHRDM
jgi:hypothetical protein